MMADDVVEETPPPDNPSPSTSGQSWSSWGAWGQSWIDTVKEKSASTMEKVKEKSAQTMEMVKKDLNEFVDVIQGDTSEAISETAAKIDPADPAEETEGNGEANFDSLETATKVVRKGMATFLSSVSELMAIPPDDTNDEVVTIHDDSSTTQYDRKHEKLRALQTDPGTYCNEPEGLFADWLQVFNLDDNKQDIANILVQNSSVRAIYTQLVPAVVSHTTFWQRYFYQVFILETAEKRREEIVVRANKETSDDADENSGWGEDDDEDGIEVVSSSSLPDHSVDVVNITNGSAIQQTEDQCRVSNTTTTTTTSENETIDIQTIGDVIQDPNGGIADYEDAHSLGGGETESIQESAEIININGEEDMDNKTLETSAEIIDVGVQSSETLETSAEIIDVGAQSSETLETSAEIIDVAAQSSETLETSAEIIDVAAQSSETLETSAEIIDVGAQSSETLETSAEIVNIPSDEDVKTDERLLDEHSENVMNSDDKVRLKSPLVASLSQDEGSVGSWMSIDDEIKVKPTKGEMDAKCDENELHDTEGLGLADVSTDSNNGVIVNPSDLLDSDEEDFDLDDEDVDEEDVAKMVDQIKNMSTGAGNLDDDDDWEKWE